MTNKKNPLLSFNNAKTVKSIKFGYETHILYMSHHTNNDKGINLCSHASQGCIDSCLVGSGRGSFTNVVSSRLGKANYFLNNRIEFLEQIKTEIEKLQIKVAKKGLKLAIRLNGTTDIRFEKFKVEGGKNIFELFPDVQFYDYTKNHLRFDAVLPKNYHLTFSRSETNNEKSLELLKRGNNVAMVFTNLPDTYKGFKVVDGDVNDMRFTDGKNVIVGLKYKKVTGKGADNTLGLKSNFVIEIE